MVNSIKLITDRTILFPITPEIISNILKTVQIGNNSVCYISNNEWPEDDLKEALPFFKELLDKNGVDGFNLWIIAEKNTGLIIGSAGYLGKPDENGNIEIGFGIIPSKRGKGYCQESVKSLIEWGLSQDHVKTVIAKCEKDNIASRKTIEKLGFKYIGETNNLLEWTFTIL